MRTLFQGGEADTPASECFFSGIMCSSCHQKPQVSDHFQTKMSDIFRFELVYMTQIIRHINPLVVLIISKINNSV